MWDSHCEWSDLKIHPTYDSSSDQLTGLPRPRLFFHPSVIILNKYLSKELFQLVNRLSIIVGLCGSIPVNWVSFLWFSGHWTCYFQHDWLNNIFKIMAMDSNNTDQWKTYNTAHRKKESDKPFFSLLWWTEVVSALSCIFFFQWFLFPLPHLCSLKLWWHFYFVCFSEDKLVLLCK